MIYKYLDASRYQGKIDWEAVKRSGKIDGAILKTVSTNKSFGGVYIDPQFERNYSECTRLGIPVGAYYYTYAQNEATRAVELVKVKQALMGKSFQLPVAVDVEDNKLKPIPAKELSALVAGAAKQIEAWGLYAMVYTYTSYANTELDHGCPENARPVDRGLPRQAAHPQARHLAVYQQRDRPRHHRRRGPEPRL